MKMLVRVISPFLLLFLTSIYKVCQGASLTFVIDDTRSMGNDIKQVRRNVDSIMDIVLDEKSSQISNIVLVSFNDPDVKLRKITKSRQELKAAMARVRVNNFFNYDCPEMALSGIKLAIESSQPGSYIYVFTDASAKDYHLSEEIQQLCQRKQTQVVFVLTGDCKRPNSKLFKVYYDIATASSGLAFRVQKNEVEAVLRTIQETIKGNKTVLSSRVTPADEYTDVPFWIDDQTEYAIVSASGTYVSLEIHGPSDSHLDMEKIMWTRNGKVMKIKKPDAGKYVATVKGSSATSVVITGRSDFLFHHGFSEQEPKSIDDTTPQPFSDTLTHLSFLVTDPKHSVRIKSAQILDMKENVIKNLTLKELSPNFYTTEPIAAPTDMFKVALIGEDVQTGKPVRRIAKIPVTPQKAPPSIPLAKSPVVQIKEGSSIEVARGGELTLTCKVSAYPEPVITWTNDKGITVPSTTSRVQLPYDYISYLKISKVSEGATYHCHAKNVLNKDDKAINVVTKDPITVKSVPEGTTKIAYGTESTLNCDVISPLPLDIKWYHVNKITGKTEHVTPSKKYSISSDGKQLKIVSMDVDLVGKYTCKAYVIDNPNEKKEFSTNVEINGLVAPKIVSDTEVVTVGEHMPATIKCKILEAIPKPRVSWEFHVIGSASSIYQSILSSDAELRIPSAELHNAGFYRCVASNDAGSDERTVAELVVVKAPAVTIEEGANVTVQYGSLLTLTCKVTAHPPPTVTWTDGQGKSLLPLISGSKNDFTYTYEGTNMKESGTYECRAENNQGSKTESIQVTVLPAFKVHSHPPDTIEIPYGNRVDLKCDINSNLPMKIEWYYASDSVSASTKLSSSDKMYETSSDGSLKIKSMDVDLTGAYTCKASLIDDPNVTKSFTTKIDIRGLVPPEIDPSPIKKEINETNPTVLTCKILRGVPKPKISWQMMAVGATEYHVVPGSGSELRIEQTKLANSGHYKCVAENAAGRREQVVAELVVLKAPVVAIVGGARIDIPYGSQHTLTCRVTAHPEPTVVWKDSAENTLPANGSVANSGFEYTYTLNRANVKVSDNYSCSAINDQGSNFKNIQVSVSSPFNVRSHPSDSTTGKYGTEVIVKCDITSNFPMKIHWYHTKDSTKEQREIETSEQYTILSNGAELKINALNVGLDGKYACKASLQEDADENVEFTTQVKIDGLELPMVTGNGNQKVKVGASVTIKCDVVKGVPKPKLSWQFKSSNSGEYEDMNNTGSEWHISKVTVRDSGYYTCTARNSLGSGVYIVALTVEEPPRINTDEFIVYKGIIGDIALRIPCEAVGSPKPSFEWKVNGVAVTLGKKYAIEDGALIIHHPERSDNNYTCTAINTAGSDTKTFRGVVDYTLSDYGTLHDVYILEGASKEITCSLPRSDSSTVKWFIEPQGIISDKPNVTVENAKLYDDGNYTCHVSDIHGSATETYVVDVGYPPKFKFPQDHNVEWSGDTEDVLSCFAHAKPEAKVEWTLNGEPLVGVSSSYLRIVKWGQYTCNVSNVHGAVKRDFEVKPTVCLISRNNKDASHMPLMLNEELSWPDFQTSGEYMIMKPGDKLMLTCHNNEKSPNSFRKFPKISELEASCDNGDTFIVDGKPHQLKDLQCTNEIYPAVEKTGTKCLTETSELMRVGYELNGFVEAYEVCFDHARNIPLFTRVLMSRTNDMPSAFNKWFQYPGIGNGGAGAYTCETSSSSCCYAKAQLASATDLSYGAAQNSSFIYPLNAVPSWRPCNSDRTTWEKLEKMVRTQLDINSNFVVWSGVHTLQEKNGSVIPRYLWKVVRESEVESIAIVYVNDASPTVADIKCSDNCADKVPWFTTSDEYTYCCTVADFLAAFNIAGDVVGESLDLSDQQVVT